jgi:AraC-type transcriptional regulator
VNQPSGLVRLILVHLDKLTQLGLSRDVLLREAKIDERQLRDPDGRIPLKAVARLWRAADSQVSDPAFGLRLGSETAVREWGLVGYAMAFSSTLAPRPQPLRPLQSGHVGRAGRPSRRRARRDVDTPGRAGRAARVPARAFQRWFGRSPRSFRGSAGSAD